MYEKVYPILMNHACGNHTHTLSLALRIHGTMNYLLFIQ